MSIKPGQRKDEEPTDYNIAKAEAEKASVSFDVKCLKNELEIVHKRIEELEKDYNPEDQGTEKRLTALKSKAKKLTESLVKAQVRLKYLEGAAQGRNVKEPPNGAAAAWF